MKIILPILFIVPLLFSCNENSSDKEDSSAITTNFAVTGSGQEAVAQSYLDQGLNLIVPSAIALTPPPLVDATGSSVQLNEAWIVLKKIQFKTSEVAAPEEENETEFHYKGPFFIDLLSDNPISFGEISLHETGIRRVKMLLHKENNVPSSVPNELNGKSIYLKGRVNGHNFSYLADDTTDFEIKGSRPIVPEAGMDFLATIRVADLFKKINLSIIRTDTLITSNNRIPAVNPCPLIHPTSTNLYTCFRTGIGLAARFGKDNGDKDLDASDEIVNE